MGGNKTAAVGVITGLVEGSRLGGLDAPNAVVVTIAMPVSVGEGDGFEVAFIVPSEGGGLGGAARAGLGGLDPIAAGVVGVGGCGVGNGWVVAGEVSSEELVGVVVG